MLGLNLRRIAIIGAAVVVATLVGLWLCDGPVWRLTLPATVPAAIRADVARLHSWRASTRAWACRNLATGGAAAAPYLIEHADDSSGATCIQSLEAMGGVAVPALIEALNTNPRERIRQVAAELLGETRDSRALPHLRLALFDASPDVQFAVVDSLAAFCDPKALLYARSEMNSDDEAKRAAGVRRLGKCDSEDARLALEAALRDPAAAVAKEAELALSRRRLR